MFMVFSSLFIILVRAAHNHEIANLGEKGYNGGLNVIKLQSDIESINRTYNYLGVVSSGPNR